MEAFDIPALHALCIELSIPGPAAEACLAQAASAQAAPLLRHIPERDAPLDRPLAVRPRLLGLAAALRAAAPPRHTGIRGASPAR